MTNQDKKITTVKPTTSNQIKFPLVQFPLPVESTLLKEYLTKNTGLIISNYGRIGGLLRMAASDKKVSEMIKDWYETNLSIGYSQIEEVTAQVEAAELMADEDDVVGIVTRPEAILMEWNVNHPIFKRIVKLIKKADKEITKAENLYYLDLIDDSQYKMLQAQVLNILSGLLDRVIKATSPGKRTEGKDSRYFPAQMMNHVRNGGYRLEFFDLPSAHKDLAQEYNARHEVMKSLLDERAEKAEKPKVIKKVIEKPSTNSSSEKDEEVTKPKTTSVKKKALAKAT